MTLKCKYQNTLKMMTTTDIKNVSQTNTNLGDVKFSDTS